MSQSPSRPRIRVLHVQPHLPEALEPLRELAFNLYWAWTRKSVELFRELDVDLWRDVGHNPVTLLGRVDQARLEEAARDESFLERLQLARESLHQYLGNGSWFSTAHPDLKQKTLAYFSAEFGITECLPIYSGGLGVLAGDHLKSASDLGIPLVGVGLAYSEGYFQQYLNADGWQQERYLENDLYDMPIALERDEAGEPVRISVTLPGREVTAQIWRVQVGRVPLFLLDANVPENSVEDQAITRRLYGGGSETRIQQEILLGIGGYRALEALGRFPDVCHMNEGHAAFLGLERTRRLMERDNLDFETARYLTSVSCVFTTHTPVAAGFDLFEPDLVRRYFEDYAETLGLSWEEFLCLGQMDDALDSRFNMALLASRHATFRNGVSRLHGKVTRAMMSSWWPGYPEEEVPVESVTNGVHMRTWISPPVQRLLNKYVGKHWTQNPADSSTWSAVDSIPDEELWEAHQECKTRLVEFSRVRLVAQLRECGATPEEVVAAGKILDPNKLTIGFARRFASYKRADLILHDVKRLKKIINREGRGVQFVFAGKAHPMDDPGKELIKRIVHFAQDPEVRASVVFLENYDINVGRHLVQGVDVWLNNPRRPLEASGTSGMKAAANGVLNLSVLDGWWDEGYTPDVGWAIGQGEQYDEADYQDTVEANALYDRLERDVVNLFYAREGEDIPRAWIARMKACIRQLTWQFNTNRMVSEYAERFYAPSARRMDALGADGGARAREFMTWSQHVRRHWDDVSIESVDQSKPETLHVGSSLDLAVLVDLGGLRPEDVSVEAYHGHTDADHNVHNGRVTRLEYVEEEGQFHRFRGSVVCPVSGLYGYSVRVRPRHHDAIIPKELPLIAWH